MDVEVRGGSRPVPVDSAAGDFATWGPVHLDVTDERRSLEFWSGTVGLQVLERSAEGVRLGVEDGAELLVLHPGASAPVRRGHSGLYHLAIHLPSEAEFARALGRLLTRGVPNAPTDHIMHWATYLSDPDGIGVELSFETLDRFGSNADGRPMLIDSEGRLRGATEPLDLQEVFSYLGDRELERPLPASTRIGHVHLHVAAVQPALDFYQALGFHLNLDFSELPAPARREHLAGRGRSSLTARYRRSAPPRAAGALGIRARSGRRAAGRGRRCGRRWRARAARQRTRRRAGPGSRGEPDAAEQR